MAVSNEKTAAAVEDGSLRLARLGRHATLALWWERLWPRLIVLAAVAGAFFAVSWLGLWLDRPVIVRMVGLGVFVAAFIAAAIWLGLTPRPSRQAIFDRLDRDAATPHRPATSLADQLANTNNDPATHALWLLHRRRLESAVAKLRVAAPRPQMERRDRYALRAVVLLALVAAAFVAGPEKYARVAAAFDWRNEPAAVHGYRLDAWIDPPAYTGLPPIILPAKLPNGALPMTAATSTPASTISAPSGSVLVVRMSAGLDVAAVVTGKLEVAAKRPSGKPEKQAMDAVALNTAASSTAAPGAGAPDTGATDKDRELRWILKGNGTLAFQRSDARVLQFDLVAIPDLPPSIAITDVPVGNARGSLAISFRTKDDYGVVSADAMFSKPHRRDGTAPVRSLVAAPKAALTLPPGSNGIGDGKTTVDLSEHPWAGASVTMVLTAHDEGGNAGESAPITVLLPQRPFLKPLARALVEQRRDLVLAPDERQHVAEAIAALMLAPEEFTPEASVYLGLRTISMRLHTARNDDDLRGVADLMWEMALRLEDGGLSDAERQLRAAEQQLREAMHRGASEAEIKKLTEDMRAALDRFLNEMAQQDPKDPKNAQGKNAKPSRTITPDDLKKMMDRMADAARKGDMADAQQMLDQLQSVLENLKTSRGKGENDDPTAREMSKSMNELDQMTREQQALRDKTFREGQKKRDADRDRRGSQDQPGANGQEGGNDDQAENSEGGDKGQEREGGSKPSDKELRDRQDKLQKQLGDLKKRLKENGVAGEKGLEEADEAMKEAGRMLNQGRDGKAVGSQGRAIEGLRRGAQGLAQKMEPGNGTGEAEGEGSGKANGRQRSSNGRDPLDRPSSNELDAMRGGLLNGGPGAAERAQQVLQELRRRLSDPQRAPLELDYLERLLRRY